MSTMRLSTAPIRKNVKSATPKLFVVPSALRNAKPSAMVATTVIVALVFIAILKLFLGIAVSQGAYELSALKREKIELTTKSQILAAEVDSLSSQQNLANSAQALGMIANANPVFLRLADEKVLGKPKSALSTVARVSKNLVANGALVTTSIDVAAAKVGAVDSQPSLSNLTTTKTTFTNVNAPNPTTVKVALPSNGIPAIPTR